MQLSRYTDYSLRILIYLGIHRERLSSINEIATCYNISQNHLMKIVHNLGKSGFITTVRGRRGGLQLNKKPEEITLSSVIRNSEESSRPIKCKACIIEDDCIIQDVVIKAFEAFYNVLNQYTLADAIRNRVKLETLFTQANQKGCNP
ncbi:HTH-type transcriptional repressor NsrR [Commensalibacter sp. Nvir]|uniref:RrF2 family transcriptional regulator n=1 Tax=Commensalibacter sp. Nvir TaxID=3069817 RepID=UPI002D5D68FB|nr:HTH-type transcriptional repressor NsrR [Commensalibacter sp. Nvir]